MPRILGLDPGFAALGTAVLELDAAGPRIFHLGIVQTAAEDKRLLQVEDNVRRLREILEALEALIAEHRPRAIAAEAFSPPRSSSVAAKLALVWGAIATLAHVHRLPILQCSPQAVKRWAKGQGASKLDVGVEVRRHCGREALRFLRGVPHGLHDHAWDAAAVVLVCAKSEIVRAMRGPEPGEVRGLAAAAEAGLAS